NQRRSAKELDTVEHRHPYLLERYRAHGVERALRGVEAVEALRQTRHARRGDEHGENVFGTPGGIGQLHWRWTDGTARLWHRRLALGPTVRRPRTNAARGGAEQRGDGTEGQ